MTRLLLAALCAVMVGAGPSSQPAKINYSSPAKIIESIPAKLMPVAGRGWDAFSDDRMNEWLKENAVGKTVSDVAQISFGPHHSDKAEKEKDPRWFGGNYESHAVVRGHQVTFVVEVYCGADQEGAISRMKNGDKVKFSGEIKSAELRSSGDVRDNNAKSVFFLSIDHAKIIR